MRIRYKKWARPELEACPFYIDDPAQNKGQWIDAFKQKAPLHLELVCGKGTFISTLAVQNPNINYLAVDLVDAMLGLCKRNIETSYKANNKATDNIIITRYDIERILDFMSSEDIVDRIYINFCNPWPKPKHKKKRLTHPKQLEHYKEFLKPEGEIYFKTDDDRIISR